MTKHYNCKEQKELRKKLRKDMPKSKRLLWNRLRNKQLNGYGFRRQHSVGPYIINFYCSSAKLAIELDGDSHYLNNAQEKDRVREKFIEQFGICFLRFTNAQVSGNVDEILATILRNLENNLP